MDEPICGAVVTVGHETAPNQKVCDRQPDHPGKHEVLEQGRDQSGNAIEVQLRWK